MSPNPSVTRPIRVSPRYNNNTIPNVTTDKGTADLTETDDECDGDDEERNDGHEDDDDMEGGMPGSSFSLEGLSFFPQQLASKVDWITQCHNPFELFQSLGFVPPSDSGEQPSRDQPPSLPHGISATDDSHSPTTYIAFRLPNHCEYCGSPSTKECGSLDDATTTCRPTCERPATYFPILTPPFSQKGKQRWKQRD